MPHMTWANTSLMDERMSHPSKQHHQCMLHARPGAAFLWIFKIECWPASWLTQANMHSNLLVCSTCWFWRLGELLVQGKPVCIVLHEQKCDSPPVIPAILAHVLDVDGLSAAHTGLLTVLNVSANTGGGLQHLSCWIRQNSWHVDMFLWRMCHWLYNYHNMSRTSRICWVTPCYS